MKKGEAKNCAMFYLRFVSILFLIFEKGDEQKFRLFFFKICKYTFFNISKGWSAKNWARFFLRFVSIPFLIFEKGGKQKIGQDFF